jgi:4-amino-4-deoxy-L-arabinose transferase-like glycosyltransferase
MGKKLNIFLLVAAVFIFKLILLPFSETTDADAVTRIFLSIKWLDNPHWIMTDVWAPFHYYLNAFSLSIWDNRVIMPKLVQVTISCLTLLPFYFFVKREFNEKGAFFATLFLAFCPILFRTSFMSLSNAPFLFFLALAINEISKGLEFKKNSSFIFAGLFLTLSSGFRYESWLIIAIFTGLLFVYKKPKQAFILGAFASLFPLSWMYSNYVETGNALYSINGNYKWTHVIMGVNEDINWKEYIKRLVFFPYSWLLLVGVPTGIIILKNGWKTFTIKNQKQLFWLVPFLVLFLFMVYNSLKGNLLNHHRFTGTLVLFSLPFFALYFEQYSTKKRNYAILFLMITIGLSFFQIALNKGAQPFPIVKESYCNQINTILKSQDQKADYLLVDFLSWESTYNIALKSEYQPSKIYLQEGAKHSQLNSNKLQELIKANATGIVIYKHNSPLHAYINSQIEQIQPQEIEQVEDIHIVRLSKRIEKPTF